MENYVEFWANGFLLRSDENRLSYTIKDIFYNVIFFLHFRIATESYAQKNWTILSKNENKSHEQVVRLINWTVLKSQRESLKGTRDKTKKIFREVTMKECWE